MKAKLLVIFTVLALALALPRPAAATITTYNLDLNNIGGQGITFQFTFNTTGNVLTFTSDSAGTSGGTFVRFDKIGYDFSSPITLTSSAADGGLWATVGNPPGNCNADGFGSAQGCIMDTNMSGLHTTPLNSTWTFSGGLVGPLDAHVIFANGCTFWASTSPAFNGNTTSSTDSQTGACAGSLTPEPSSLVLFGGGLLGLAAFIRRRPNLWASMWAARA